ncbi:AraC family transcriptional regulator [Streptomyces sp. NPDC001941]|uniref:AraC family transcriptional regulator n=1 Tax=Streptomyces sp. NPDC001941 TaxID=3154659 RepID=UPI00331EEF96
MAGPEQPATGVESYLTRSLDEARTAVAAHFYDMRFEVTGVREDFALSLDVVQVGALTIGLAHYTAQVRTAFGQPGAFHLALPFEGGLSVQQGLADPLYASAREGVLFDPAQYIRIDEISAGCRVLTVKVDKTAVVRQLEQLIGRPVPGELRLGPRVDLTGGRGRSWLELAAWTLRDRADPGGLLHEPMFAGRLEQSLLEGLLLTADHRWRTVLERPAPGMRPAHVKRVMDAVRDRPAEPYDANGLAAIAQVSVRTLQDAFRRSLGMSPMAYVSEVRLERAHRQLRSSAPGAATVTEIARQWGFAHLGRFAQRYRARFGESPSQTLAAR